MNTPLITWCLIAALFVLIVARQIFKAIHLHTRLRHAAARHHGHRRLIENGNEWEMLYLPGDTNGRDEHRYDEYEAEYDSDYLTDR